MKFSSKLRAIFRRAQVEAEMTEEMRRHVELQTELNITAGMAPDAARFAALRQFGNVANIQEQCREQRSWIWLEQAGQDLGYAVRQLVKSPGFAATVVITLALGIGACTVVFTAINSTLLHPLAGDAVNGEVLIHETQPPSRPQMQLSAPMFLDLERETQSFEYLTAWASLNVNMQTDTEPLQLRGAAISADQLKGWSAAPALGRNFTTQEFAQGERVIMLGYSLWQRAFGGSPDVIKRSVIVDGLPYAVVGIISPQFARYGSDLEFWMPLFLGDQQRAQSRGARYLQTGAKLKRGVTLKQAQAELDVIATNIARQYPDTNKDCGLLVRDFGAYINRSLAPMLYILLGAVGCVLLIACANVANLLLARATVRQREISIRAALGAGRGRIMRQLLVESLLLAVMGGAAGIMLASWGLRFIRIYGPTAGTDMARLAFIELDPAVLAFTLGFSLLTGLVFGLAPAWLGAHVDLNETLKQGTRGSTEGGLRGSLRRLLVVVEVALALVLLAGAGLLVKSFSQLAQVDPGFEPARVATMRIGLDAKKYNKPEARSQFTEQLLERIQVLPGVEAAAISNRTPFNSPYIFAFTIAGRPPSVNQPRAIPSLITPDYFRAMGIHLIRGRTFEKRDGVSGPVAFIINESLARQYFPNEEPLGQSIVLTFGKEPGPTGEIVGVVADVMQGTPGEAVMPEFYLPWAALPEGVFDVMVRTTGDPAVALAMVKSQVHTLDRDQPVGGARPMQSLMDDKLARPHLMLKLLGAFGLIALVIAAVGIYGVMAYSVSQRTVEFGIRMALGASRGDVLRQVLRHGMRVVAFGLFIGLGVALLLGQVVQSLLYNTNPRDPVTLIAIVFLLLSVSFVACLLPARRATKVDPMVALRTE